MSSNRRNTSEIVVPYTVYIVNYNLLPFERFFGCLCYREIKFETKGVRYQSGTMPI
jgi:hypothetical protein